jgi:hypothetical protein
MGFRDAGDQNLDESHVNRNCVRHDRKMGAMTDVSHDHRRSDRLDDLSSYVTKSYRVDLTIDPLCYVTDDRNDLMTDVNLDVNLCLRTSDQLDDHHDRKMDENLDGNHDHHVSDLLVYRNLDDDLHDLNLVASRVIRNCVRCDLMTDGNLDVNHDHRMNVKDDLNLDVNRGHRMNVRLDDRKTDENHVNRNYAPRDLKMDANLVVKNLHVKLMVYLCKNCDRMSHDHLRYDRRMMRRHDTNQMDVKNPDGKMKNSGAMNSDARMT